MNHAVPNLQRAASEIVGNFPLDDAVIEGKPPTLRISYGSNKSDSNAYRDEGHLV